VNLDVDINNCGTCGTQCGALSECGARECAPVPLEFVRIEAGTFQMGSPEDELGRGIETRHSVTLSRAFLIGRTEVTQGQWQAIMNTDATLEEQPNIPMNTNWWEAAEFANNLSLSQGLPACYNLNECAGIPGQDFDCASVTVNAAGGNPLLCTGYRLLTESEWEYAYRAGTTTAFYNGGITSFGCEPLDDNLNAIGWYCGNLVLRVPQNVSTKLPNEWGLYDMAGNMMEWVWDWYADYPGTVSDPLGPSAGTARVLRGGHYAAGSTDLRAASRVNGSTPNTRYMFSGFRLARTAP
jgi:formylglycine-generating enzyme required for sulfatase activity